MKYQTVDQLLAFIRSRSDSAWEMFRCSESQAEREFWKGQLLALSFVLQEVEVERIRARKAKEAEHG